MSVSNLLSKDFGFRTFLVTEASAAGRFPFDGTINDDQLTVRPGTVNQIIATNYQDSFTIDTETKQYFVLDCVINNGRLVSMSFAVDAEEPGAPTVEKNLPPSTFKILVAILDNGSYNKVIGNGMVTANVVEVYRAAKPPGDTGAGELPLDIYYTWSIG